MKKSQVTIKLPEGKFTTIAQIFDKSDDVIIKNLYYKWIDLSKQLRDYGGRGINLPEVLSESIFCRVMGTIRINENILGANTSFDVFNPTTNKRIQVKSCSVLPDLTSFGPNSVWDELYFMDFYNKGKFDGQIDIYLIPNRLIYDHKVNKTQTVKDQQKEGRRPRFSIFKEIIERQNIKPLKRHKV
jgi:hypothetical protein